VLAASAAITFPTASQSKTWSIPGIDLLTAALTTAEVDAATARAEAMASAPVCQAYKRKNVFVAKCKYCRRSKTKCKRSRDAHAVHLAAEKRVADTMVKMNILNSAVSLSRFMSERPGLVRVVGVRLLRYYYANVAKRQSINQ